MKIKTEMLKIWNIKLSLKLDDKWESHAHAIIFPRWGFQCGLSGSGIFHAVIMLLTFYINLCCLWRNKTQNIWNLSVIGINAYLGLVQE